MRVRTNTPFISRRVHLSAELIGLPLHISCIFAHSGQWHTRRPLTQRWRLAAALVRTSRGAGGDQQAAQGPAPLPGRRMRERSNAREVILPETPNLVRFASSGPLDRTVVVTLCTESRHPLALIALFS